MQAFSDIVGGEGFKVLIMSDPQPDRLCPKYGYPTIFGRDPWIQTNRPVVEGMNKLIEQASTTPTTIDFGIINGDLTEFGWLFEHDLYRETYPNKILVPVYEGLGNHDYVNNKGDCWLFGYTTKDGCAINSINYMASRYDIYKSNINQKTNFNYDWNRVSFGHYVGSLSYSFDYFGVHFVQLQNYPTYHGQYYTFGWTYDITPSLDWLEKDLKAATTRGQKIILNWHDGTDHIREDRNSLEKFKKILLKYKVSAIFLGHYHRQYYSTFDGTGIPMYMPGALFCGGYYVVNFQDKKMYVNYYATDLETGSAVLMSSREQNYYVSTQASIFMYQNSFKTLFDVLMIDVENK